MDDLALQLDNTIQALEELRGAMDDPKPANVSLKALTRHKLALDKASIDGASAQYRETVQAMSDAAATCRTAIADVQALETALSSVGKALQLLAKLRKAL